MSVEMSANSPVMAESAVQQFAQSLRGTLIRRGDSEYEQARHVYNAMIDRHPVLIVRCATLPMSLQRSTSHATTR